MKAKMLNLAVILTLVISLDSALAFSGATVPWTTYEAENMTNNGTVLGPSYTPNTVAGESSGRQCVQLSATGQFMQFSAVSTATAIVVRYSVPDTADGKGTDYTLSLYKNGAFVAKLPMTSRYSWLYGSYSFTNNPPSGSPRNFYDEVRTNGLSILPGDVIRLEKDASDTATTYTVDLVDLENAPAAISQPGGAVSIKSSPYNAVGDGVNDDTTALQLAINGNSNIYLPPGNYKITGAITINGNKTVQGAGMWYTTLVGDTNLYGTVNRRILLNGNGSNIRLSDIAIMGKLSYRNDNENPNDGIGGAYGTGSTISNMWVEHTKTGAWIANSSGLVVNSCRFRDIIADGINCNVGMRGCIVTNCTARGCGDDCFAFWPATFTTQNFTPGLNVITHCTALTPFLANGGAIYGAISNRIEDCVFQDITYGCGILISTTFPVGGNTFSGTTFAQRCDVIRCGGFDPGYKWRAAVQLTIDSNAGGITGLNLNNLNIVDSASDGLSIIGNAGSLSGAIASYINIPNYGLGTSGRNALYATNNAIGSLTVSNSTIAEVRNDSSTFTFNFVTSNIPVTVQTSPTGLSFSADTTNFSAAQNFNWKFNTSHTVATISPQSGGAGVQYSWNSWNDAGAISHAVTAYTNFTYTGNFTTQYLLTMNAATGGTVSPTNSWNNSGANVNISATVSNGYVFNGWIGSGSGSYSGTNNPAPVTMNGPITETASFAPIPTRLISLSGALDFGDVTVGGSSNLTFAIGNTGNSTLTVSGITYPTGFSGNWSGTVSSGSSTNVTATFLPQVAGNYTGNLAVNSDATSGGNTLTVSGTGVATTNDPPDNLTVSSITPNPDSSVTITYTTTPTFTYHVEVTSDLVTGTWAILTSSITNATSGTVTFTDPGAADSPQRFYRVRSP
ncbi:MAG TPA: glycosyl hydrolase family 28-related protein [Verrucomicrobiae bacterium]|nr:glycosyl hydrolase family 28-related protein [Verrucomicrobiae bacterium]